MREDVRASSAVGKAVDGTGAVEKVVVVVNEVRRVPKEASKVSRDAKTSLSISLIEFMGKGSADLAPPGVAKAIVDMIDTSFGKRPFRVHVESMDLLW